MFGTLMRPHTFAMSIVLTGLFFALRTSAEAPNYHELNQRMIKTFNEADAKTLTRSRGNYNSFSALGMDEGMTAIRNANLREFVSTADFVTIRDTSLQNLRSLVEEVITQEYLRGQPKGLPWLPLSWSVYHTDVESTFSKVSEGLEKVVQAFPTPLDDNDLLRIYLFTQTVPHTADSNLISTVRNDSWRLEEDDSSFADVRAEIHQDPSLSTLARIDKYLTVNTNENRKNRALEIRKNLLRLFGKSDPLDFIRSHPWITGYTNNGYNFQNIVDALTASGDAKLSLAQVTTGQLKTQLGQHFQTLKNLGEAALRTRQRLLSIKQNGANSSDPRQYELLEVLSQIQREVFSLGQLLQHAIVQNQVPLSLQQILEFVKAYVDTNVAIGLFSESASGETQSLLNLARSSTSLSDESLGLVIEVLESETRDANQRVRDIFNPWIEKYSQFVEPSVAELLVAEILRSSALGPMENLLSTIHSVYAVSIGRTMDVNRQPWGIPYRVLNAGISKGRIYAPTNSELQDPNFYWDPHGIYLLEKTPAEINKVAGIISSHTGSLVSHVQLIAANLGIPNIYMPRANLRSLARSYIGQEIYLIALSNGEAKIVLANNATQKELDVYHKYNKVSYDQKVTLALPSQDVFAPVSLDSLRYDDSIAGGKAKGQAELTKLFSGTVPGAIVLPFGVYWHHITKKFTDPQSGKTTSLYDIIQKLLSDKRLKGDTKEASELRRKTFASIRNAITRIKLAPELERFIIKKFTQHPKTGQVDFVDKGVFVRSDTNAEDLATFVGAGLNKTEPNIQAMEEGQLMSSRDLNMNHALNVLEAIKRVWASPFTEKAYSWRKELIENPWDVLPSVVIQIGVNSQRAGVMTVGDPESEDYDDLIYIGANAGIGVTFVNGEASPEVVTYSRKKKAFTRVRSTNAQEKLALKNWPYTGLTKVTIDSSQEIITEKVAKTLADMGDKIQKHMAANYGFQKMKWDIEFGVVGDKVYLFQVRPFVGNKVFRDVALLSALESKTKNKPAKMIDPKVPSIQLLGTGD